jgi:transposase
VQLLSALPLQLFYGIGAERQLMEQLDYNVLYHWFAFRRTIRGPNQLHQEKNPDRLQNSDVFAKFMSKLLNQSEVQTAVVSAARLRSAYTNLRERSLF